MPLLRLAPSVLSASLLASLLLLGAAGRSPAQTHGEPANPLPRPGSLAVDQFEAKLFAFLNQREYAALGWARDKSVRDTGPYINRTYYGTHPAVRVYYSPAVVRWLEDGRRGDLPDGAMIIKEQFEPPAARYEDLPEPELLQHLRDWTVMIKDARGSKDGWFWSNPARGQEPLNNKQYPFDYPTSAFGMYCVRCHASTKSPGKVNEYTFASLRNIEGFPGEPVIFRVERFFAHPKEPQSPPKPEDPDRPKTPDDLGELSVVSLADSAASHPKCAASSRPTPCQPKLSTSFMEAFTQIGAQQRDEVLRIPGVSYDWVAPFA